MKSLLHVGAGILLLAAPGMGCKSLLTEAPPDDRVFDALIDGLTPAQLKAHIDGDEAFGEIFTPETGLGPVFNQASCDGCHPSEGRGHPVNNLIRFGKAGSNGEFDYMPEHGGPQLQDRAIPGYPAERLPADATGISERGGPIVVGLGLIEAIPDDSILVRDDPGDADDDGISGRANFVDAPEWLPVPPGLVVRNGRYLGRFGRKATAITLLQQTVEAYRNDMGITTDFITEDPVNPVFGGRVGDNAPDPELSAETVQNVVFYLQTLRAPLRRNASDPQVLRGEAMFSLIGCASCHTPVMRTGPHPLPALAFKEVHLYSDLLLHDMGALLADNYPEGDATGTEWRTTPLWGLGITAELSGGVPYYLHDGRTSDLLEVIRLHGGEASDSRFRFGNLQAEDKQALIAFLESL